MSPKKDLIPQTLDLDQLDQILDQVFSQLPDQSPLRSSKNIIEPSTNKLGFTQIKRPGEHLQSIQRWHTQKRSVKEATQKAHSQAMTVQKAMRDTPSWEELRQRLSPSTNINQKKKKVPHKAPVENKKERVPAGGGRLIKRASPKSPPSPSAPPQRMRGQMSSKWREVWETGEPSESMKDLQKKRVKERLLVLAEQKEREQKNDLLLDPYKTPISTNKVDPDQDKVNPDQDKVDQD